MVWSLGPFIDCAILALAFAGGFTIIGYEDHARRYGWPVGAWLAGVAPPLKIVSVIVMLLALWKAWYLYPWWTAVIVGIAGIVVAFVASMLLRSWVQLAAVVVTIVGGAAALLLGTQVT